MLIVVIIMVIIFVGLDSCKCYKTSRPGIV